MQSRQGFPTPSPSSSSSPPSSPPTLAASTPEQDCEIVPSNQGAYPSSSASSTPTLAATNRDSESDPFDLDDEASRSVRGSPTLWSTPLPALYRRRVPATRQQNERALNVIRSPRFTAEMPPSQYYPPEQVHPDGSRGACFNCARCGWECQQSTHDEFRKATSDLQDYVWGREWDELQADQKFLELTAIVRIVMRAMTAEQLLDAAYEESGLL
ncbi:hypothetical protein XA68_11168 [Ophiocordyceps unilateralis]|uniref:Uncharacterized protein n=1 Tax=Ophiocordyceps unilateralis TaxID=268505 RepID=A0A2A9PFL5_OPHUN|nr:hypothetical protein XA68_11168 [Ophiocordyceps unilateralis]